MRIPAFLKHPVLGMQVLMLHSDRGARWLNPLHRTLKLKCKWVGSDCVLQLSRRSEFCSPDCCSEML